MTAAADPERSEDGRWIFVGGRRWRATDPSIPDSFRQELVDELMAARRSVGAAGRGADSAAEAAARRRVQATKTALGERGRAWWETPTSSSIRARLAAAILALAEHRAPDRTICPSDAARAVGGARWRSQMDLARDVVRELAAAGSVEVLQKGVVIDATSAWRGPVRIRRRN
ncbi:MAG: DUF3253 domain-containing protein [Ilumatobacteraceae bacterium]